MEPRDLPAGGHLLRDYRRERGFTQQTLAERAGISVESVSNLERGVPHRPRAETLRLLGDALELTPTERAALGALMGPLGGISTSPTTSHPSAATLELTAALLPTPLTRLVGRELELAQAAALLQHVDVRLLTLCGPPGVGKTRLGLALAAWWQAAGGERVAFMDLTAVRDPQLVLAFIAHRLGLRESGAQPIEALLREALTTQPLLLLLDNFEHLVAAAPAVAELLATCPRLRLLVTSRAPLRIRGEHLFPLAPLALPDLAALPPLEHLGQIPAVCLLLERAQATLPTFTLTEANAPAVAGICCCLDGLPLALELAAARLRLFPPAVLLARMRRHRLGVLTQGARDLPPHQRSLRATLAWSYALLAPQEQQLFRRLAVFAGGATLAAVEAIGVGALPDAQSRGTRGTTVVEALSSLMDQHLVERAAGAAGAAEGQDVPEVDPEHLEETEEETRVRLLETIREFSQDLLSAAGERDAALQQHAGHYLHLAERAAQDARGQGQPAAYHRLEQERENLRAALRWALARREVVVGLRLVVALARFWYVRGYLSEGRAWITQVLALVPEPLPPEWASWHLEALRGLGNIALRQGDLDFAQSVLETCLAAQRQTNDLQGAARSLNSLAIIAREQGHHSKAQALWEQSLALRRELEDTLGLGVVLANLATVAHERGAFAEAARLYEESLQYSARAGDLGAVAMTLNNWGFVEGQRGEYAHATELAEDALARGRALHEKLVIAVALHTLGELARQQGATERAEAYCDEGLRLAREVGDTLHIATVLTTLGSLAVARGDGQAAQVFHAEVASIYTASLAARRQRGDRQGIADVLLQLATLALEDEQVGHAQAGLQESPAICHELQLQVSVARCLEGLARVALAGGEWERVVRYFGTAQAIRQKAGAPLAPVDAKRYGALLAPAWAALGAARTAALMTACLTLPAEEVVQEALARRRVDPRVPARARRGR
jgi:predicted ATPase/DNA-binding XRE family transcriptional regulator